MTKDILLYTEVYLICLSKVLDELIQNTIIILVYVNMRATIINTINDVLDNSP